MADWGVEVSAPGHAANCDACCHEVRSCVMDAEVKRIDNWGRFHLEVSVRNQQRVAELEAALVNLLGAVDDKAFMAPDQQHAVWTARKLVGK